MANAVKSGLCVRGPYHGRMMHHRDKVVLRVVTLTVDRLVKKDGHFSAEGEAPSLTYGRYSWHEGKWYWTGGEKR